jgi:hypothetical protein|tara:strand:- start:943 stop:1944 length:1002 start_codon:yes stop_codon:yes gene_type:complete
MLTPLLALPPPSPCAVKSFFRFVTFDCFFKDCFCHCFCHKCGKSDTVSHTDVELTTNSDADGGREAEGADRSEDEEIPSSLPTGRREAEAEGDDNTTADEDDADGASGCHMCLMLPFFWCIECMFPGIRKPNLPTCICCVAWFRAFRYHFGTLAVTSFIIAVVQLIQTIAAYLLVKAKLSGASNPIVQKILYAVQGVLTFVQCCIKHINKSMFAVMSMRGGGFVPSITHTGELLTSNILTVSALKISSLFIIVLGKAMVTLASAGTCYCWLYYDTTFDASTGAMPVTSNVLPFSINILCVALCVCAACVRIEFLLPFSSLPLALFLSLPPGAD